MSEHEDQAASTPQITVQELALAIYQGGLASGCHQNVIARKLLMRYDITPKAGAMNDPRRP